MPSSRLRALGLLPLLLGAGSCREVPTAQILVVVSTNVDMNRIAYVRVQVESPDGTIQNQRVYDIQPTGQVRFPFSLGVLPRDSDTSRRVRIVAQAFNREDRPFITRSALCGFIPDTVVRLPMFLPDRCSNVTCARALTCNDNGECVDDQVDTSRLERNPPTGGAELDGSVSVPYADASVRDAVTDDAPDAAVTADAPDATVTTDAPDATVTTDAPDASPDRAPTDTPAAEAGTYLAIPANCAYPAATNTPRTPLPATSPRLVSPLSLGQVTSLRPTLRWARPSGVDMVRVELCADRACGTVITSFTANADAQAVPAALPPGRLVFWRVTPTVGGTPSAVWYFRTPRTDLGVDTSWGAQSDFNGDGFADVTLLVGMPMIVLRPRFEVALYHGGPSGVCGVPQHRFSVPGVMFGVTVIAANGDFDGDGFGDLAYSATAPAITGQIKVRWGTPTGLSTVGEQTLGAPSAGDIFFGRTLRVLGDVNRDGYADLAVSVGSPAGLRDAGGLRVYLGGPTGLQTSPALSINGASGDELGADVVGGGADFDGDGFHDLVATRRGVGGFKLRRGAAMGLQPAIDVPAPNPMRQSAGTAVAAGDVNGDGRSDLVYLTGNTGATIAPGLLAVWPGSPTGLATTPGSTVDTPADADFQPVVRAGETSGDGLAEVLVIERRRSGTTNTLQPVLFSGMRSGGLARSPVAVDTSGATAIGSAVAFNGDTDGDNLGDFAINVEQVRAYGFGGYGLLRGGPDGWMTGAIRFVAFADPFRPAGNPQLNEVCD